MLTGDIAKYQVQDRIRAAEMERTARAAMRNRTGAKQAAVRRIGSGLMAVVSAIRPTGSAPAVRREARTA
jgi:hypothetical protein